MKTKLIWLALIALIVLAGVLRIYKLDSAPPSLNWDEAALGYNAYTIANWGMDEWGNRFPVVFTSFRDDKHPVAVYLTAIFVKLFGLDDLIIRLPSALLGTLGVVLIYLIARKLFKSSVVGLISACSLTVSPMALQFSRGLWEANFALVFYLLGLTLFLYSSEKRRWLVPLAILSFGLSFFSYHSAKVVVPPTILLLIILEGKKIIANKTIAILSVLVLVIFVTLTIKDPRILGFARASQTGYAKEAIEQTIGYQKTSSHILGLVEIVGKNYLSYFNYNYLFTGGEENPRVTVNFSGEFFKVEGILMLVGIFWLIKFRSKKSLIFLCWLLLAPIPGALASTDRNPARTIFMIGSLDILAGLGAGFIFKVVRSRLIKTIIIIGLLALVGLELRSYLIRYYSDYVVNNAIDWQYGMKQMVAFVAKNKTFTKVYVDKVRQQPYIFFLYYLKYPLPKFLATVKYDATQSKSYNTVESFDKYNFGNWDPIESYPNSGTLYAITPSYYTGLRYIERFSTNKLIKYPNGAAAFYLVSGND